MKNIQKKEGKDFFCCGIITVAVIVRGQSLCSLSWSLGQAVERIPQWRQSWDAEGSTLLSPQCVMLDIRTNVAKGKNFTQELQRSVINMSVCMYWGVPICIRDRNRHLGIYSVCQPTEVNIMSYFFDFKERNIFWRVLSPTFCYI